jgi:2-oxo-4-hydroxy-4-carboxy-5-ureidoimidazoline decarboxylase
MPSLAEFNGLDEPSAEQQLLGCCGSRRWVRELTAGRPFSSLEAIQEQGDRVWFGLGEEDWLEAFAAHPQIGASPAATATTGRWSSEEQAGVRTASDDVLARLARANREYENRFGFIFIVCATGKSAREMLALIERRLTGSRDEELKVAADEQRKITRLRLAKLFDGVPSRPDA